MADERKAEQTEAEKLIDSLDVGAGEDGKESVEEKGSPSEEKQKDVKGWTTILPKRFREGAKDHESLESYLDHLHEARKEESPEPETEETWESAISSIGAEDAHDRALINAMRESGLRSDAAASVYRAIKLESDAITAEYASAMKKAVGDHFAKRRQETGNYDAVLKNGFHALSIKSPDAFIDAKGKGLFNHPAVLEMVYMLGKAETESGPIDSRTGGRKDDYDPRNPLRF